MSVNFTKRATLALEGQAREIAEEVIPHLPKTVTVTKTVTVEVEGRNFFGRKTRKTVPSTKEEVIELEWKWDIHTQSNFLNDPECFFEMDMPFEEGSPYLTFASDDYPCVVRAPLCTAHLIPMTPTQGVAVGIGLGRRGGRVLGTTEDVEEVRTKYPHLYGNGQ